MIATPTHPAPPPPPPAAPAPSMVEQARGTIAAVKTGNDPWRPIRLTGKFIDGTFTEGLNGMSKYGRKGLGVGIGLGIIAAIATGGLAPLFGVALACFAIGAVAGTLKGVLTGGVDAVGRDRRAKLYADDLVQRKNIQNDAGPNLNDYRSAYRDQQMSDSHAAQLNLARTNEATKDFNTYWQQREADRSQRLPQERGLGF